MLALANQDGGAHIDPTLRADYEALSRYGSLGQLGFTMSDGTRVEVDSNSALAHTRQIAFEVEGTLQHLAE